MLEPDEIILEISLDLLVEGEGRHLDIPIPFDYDGQAILKLVLEDVLPLDGSLLDGAASLEDTSMILDSNGSVEVAGAMDPLAFDDWQVRANDLREIKWTGLDLDETGLLPGEWPGVCDERTGEPSALMLDETIGHDLANATVVRNDRKAAFRAMRETSGASQTALADALGVNVRTVKRWETPGQPEPPHDAWRLVEAWRNDAVQGANWHVKQAEEQRYDFHEAYVLVLYRSQEEFDRVLSPILAQAPSYRWQDALAEARAEAMALREDDSHLEIDHPYTNFPGTRSYWRANAAARLAAVLMDAAKIPYGFAYPGELTPGWGDVGVWIPRADVQRIESPNGTIISCGMR